MKCKIRQCRSQKLIRLREDGIRKITTQQFSDGKVIRIVVIAKNIPDVFMKSLEGLRPLTT